MRDWHTHVFTSTYTADVSGVCSIMYELGGMTILHDPSGCNSTYTTHDEPRWFDTHSLMFTSGLDEMAAIYGDDDVLIKDVVQAYNDLHPRFITLCGASIPHIIAFDYKGVAHLIEEQVGVPVIPVATDGLKSYVNGVGLASREWIRRFADPTVGKRAKSVNLLGITPIDFSREELVESLKIRMMAAGYNINACFAMGDSFEDLQNVYAASVNLVPTSAARMPARFMYGKGKVPYVEGLPLGTYMDQRVREALQKAEETGKNQIAYDELPEEGNVLVIGEEVYARSMASEINHTPLAQEKGLQAIALWPDVSEGIDEDLLIEKINAAEYVICDPLFANVVNGRNAKLISIPHEGYSGRIFRNEIPDYLNEEFDIESLIKGNL